MTHFLKTEPEFFMATLAGLKMFEVRFNDRDFKVGDRVNLEEFDPKFNVRTGRTLHLEITYVLDGFPWNREGFCIFGMRNFWP